MEAIPFFLQALYHPEGQCQRWVRCLCAVLRHSHQAIGGLAALLAASHRQGGLHLATLRRLEDFLLATRLRVGVLSSHGRGHLLLEHLRISPLRDFLRI